MGYLTVTLTLPTREVATLIARLGGCREARLLGRTAGATVGAVDASVGTRARRRVTLAVMALMLAVVACNSDDIEAIARQESTGTTDGEQTTTSEPEETTRLATMDLIVASGFTSSVDQLGVRYTSAGALVGNPSEDHAAYDVQVLFNLTSLDGSVLDTRSADVPYIPAAATVAVAPLRIGFGIAKQPVGLEVTATGDFRHDEGWAGVEFPVRAGIDLQVADAKIMPGKLGDGVLTAQITNPSDEIAEFGSWSCVFKDVDAVVGGERSGIADPIPPGATIALNHRLAANVLANVVICTGYA